MLKKIVHVVCSLIVFAIGTTEGMESMPIKPANETKSTKSGWPKIAYDGTVEQLEPKLLEICHNDIRRRGGCQMPKNKEELDFVYDQYKAGNFEIDKMASFSWWNVCDMMSFELASRLGTGNMYFINKYLDRIEGFLDAVSKFKDRDFINPLLPGLERKLIESGVWMTYAYTKPGVHYEGDRDLTLEDADNIVKRFNNMCNKSGLFKKDLMKEMYDYNVRCRQARGD